MKSSSADLSEWSDRHRLATLRGFDLSAGDETGPFEEIVRLTARLMGKSAAFVSLVERDHQWFLARHGMELAETSIQSSICRHILNVSGVTVIEDTHQDARTRGNPLCMGTGAIRFYAGAPLVTRTGEALGALAVIDEAAGTLDPFQQEVLAMLAQQVMAQLDLRRALRRSEMMRREVDHRVKNSLQSVAALTRIQARAVSSDEARDALEQVSRRINTVAALNQQMYRDDGREAQMKPFLESIVGLMRDSLPDGIGLTLEVDDLAMDPRKAGAVAVVVNEFVTNSAKHAFDERGGTVSISLGTGSLGDAVLLCRDDGMGLGEGGPSEGLGLAIIDSAIDQLSGEKTVLDGPGHGLRVIFRI